MTRDHPRADPHHLGADPHQVRQRLRAANKKKPQRDALRWALVKLKKRNPIGI